ncbi:Tmc7 protein [Operophtera brumata]|uniref:Tmc7 protein n=1 Tax=Operophtera brumata TaxID=104452 RepID=A0A0L7L9P9_OPEBR|nr:Tmc7 protein [Operophtera brumata]
MSGGNSSKHKASKRHSGWEEAGGEFYQELYPGGEGEIFENLQRADAAKLATLLPSKQARNMWHRFRIQVSEILGKLELWHSPMREIEGKFGTGVVSYFLFLRWLLFLNLGISLLIVLFLVVPKIILVEENLTCNIADNSSLCCSLNYFEKNYTDTNVFLDIIQGTGIMERTILFYGVYSDQIYTYNLMNLFDSDLYYNMPMAYILVPISWALLSLIAIVKTGARGFKERLIENEGQFYMYCNLVFGGWDFCIHNDKSAKIKHKAIYNEVKGCLEEEKYKEEKQSRTREGLIWLNLKRLLINLLVFCILIGSGMLIYVAIKYSMDALNALSKTEASQSYDGIINGSHAKRASGFYRREMSFGQIQNVFLEFLPYLTIVVLNLIIPEIFSYLIKFENYTPARALLVTLLRTVLLKLSSLGVLLRQLYMYVSVNGVVCSLDNNDPSKFECWETYVGQQLYKLLLTDFAVQFVTTFIINLPRAFIARHTNSRCFKIIGEQDFYLPKHVLDIVYIQTIIWMGTFFCPFLPIMGTVFYFIIFYIKKFTCLINCTPSPVVYKASKSKSLFMSVLLLGFLASIMPVVYSIAEVLPSMNCGPFRNFDTVWEYVVKTFDGFPYILREVLFKLGTSTFAIPAFAILLFFLYYYWAVAAANRHMVTVLRNQLVLEGHDKQFLLNRLSAFIRQHQKRCERKNRASFADDSSIRQSSR